jgi:hypothetical protein
MPSKEKNKRPAAYSPVVAARARSGIQQQGRKIQSWEAAVLPWVHPTALIVELSGSSHYDRQAKRRC